MNIPIRNLYYLLVYAWNALDEADLVDVSEQPETRIVDLFAAVLNAGVKHLLRRGLDRGYVARREDIAGVRGKLELSATIKADLLRRCRTVCEFDELTHNILHNQILRTTLRQLLQLRSLPEPLRDELAGADRRLHEIDTIPLSRQTFRSVQLHRNNRFYRFLLHVCRLVQNCLLVDEETGEVQFRDFYREPRRMRSLFERFLRNFYKREQRQFRVKRDRIRWNTGAFDAMGLLPEMLTDLSLVSAKRKIVIDAKFYCETLQTYHGKASVRSGHLYQLFAYLRNLAPRGGVNECAEGILLYPKVDQDINVSYVIQGHPFRIATLDLAQPWRDIHNRLLDLLH